jgi:cell division protein FtsB
MPTSKALNTNLSTPVPAHNSHLALGILIVFCLIFIISYTGRLVKRAQLSAEATHWEDRIEQATQQRLVLDAEHKYIESDAYIQKAARDELGMAQVGDTIVVVVPSLPTPPVPLTAIQGGEMKAAGQTNWQQWFELFVPKATVAQ